jgi:hypothetical protein
MRTAGVIARRLNVLDRCQCIVTWSMLIAPPWDGTGKARLDLHSRLQTWSVLEGGEGSDLISVSTCVTVSLLSY